MSREPSIISALRTCLWRKGLTAGGEPFSSPQDCMVLSVCVRTQPSASGSPACCPLPTHRLFIFYLNIHVMCINTLVPVSTLLRTRIGIPGETQYPSSLQSYFINSCVFFFPKTKKRKKETPESPFSSPHHISVWTPQASVILHSSNLELLCGQLCYCTEVESLACPTRL